MIQFLDTLNPFSFSLEFLDNLDFSDSLKVQIFQKFPDYAHYLDSLDFLDFLHFLETFT